MLANDALRLLHMSVILKSGMIFANIQYYLVLIILFMSPAINQRKI